MAVQLIPWQELDDTANEFVPGFGEARAYRNLVCSIRRDNPWIFTAGMLASPAGNPNNAIQLATGQWDRICDQIPLPPAAQQNQPWIGGQCATPYTVQFVVRPSTGGEVIGSETVDGPIQQLYFLTTKPYIIATRTRLEGFVRGADGVLRKPLDYVYDEPNTVQNFIRVNRTDGGPDNCGNAPIETGIPPAPIDPTFNIPIIIGGQERPVTVNIPGLDQSDFPNITFSPEFEIDGIPVRILPEGVEIDWPDNYPLAPSIEPGRTIQVQLQPIINNTTETLTNTQELIVDLSELTNLVDTRTEAILNEIEQCCNKEYDIVFEVLSFDTPGETFMLPADTYAVRVEMVGEPTPKTGGMIGPGTSANVWFWGWASPGYIGGSPGPRQPLHHLDQTFYCEPGAMTFNVGPTYGNRAKVTAVRRIRIEPEGE